MHFCGFGHFYNKEKSTCLASRAHRRELPHSRVVSNLHISVQPKVIGIKSFTIYHSKPIIHSVVLMSSGVFP